MVINDVDLAPGILGSVLAGMISPPLIAWPSTTSPEGIDDRAPFSGLNMFSVDPGTVRLGVGRCNGIDTDSRRNVSDPARRSPTVDVVDSLPQDSGVAAS